MLCPRCKRKIYGKQDMATSMHDGETTICSICRVSEEIEAGVRKVQAKAEPYKGDVYWKE